jgi:hypothetical protein
MRKGSATTILPPRRRGFLVPRNPYQPQIRIVRVEAHEGRTKVAYDMRFHFADRILRPNYPATRAARQTLIRLWRRFAADEDASEDHENKAEEKFQIPSSSPKHEVEGLKHRILSNQVPNFAKNIIHAVVDRNIRKNGKIN